MEHEKHGKRFVLIDDDQTYNTIMERVASQHGVYLDTYTSLMDLGSVALLGRYDAAIVDYNLDQMTGLEVAEYLDALFASVPMILISAGEIPNEMPINLSEEVRHWPDSIVKFVPKGAGYEHVLQQAIALTSGKA